MCKFLLWDFADDLLSVLAGICVLIAGYLISPISGTAALAVCLLLVRRTVIQVQAKPGLQQLVRVQLETRQSQRRERRRKRK